MGVKEGVLINGRGTSGEISAADKSCRAEPEFLGVPLNTLLERRPVEFRTVEFRTVELKSLLGAAVELSSLLGAVDNLGGDVLDDDSDVVDAVEEEDGNESASKSLDGDVGFIWLLTLEGCNNGMLNAIGISQETSPVGSSCRTRTELLFVLLDALLVLFPFLGAVDNLADVVGEPLVTSLDEELDSVRDLASGFGSTWKHDNLKTLSGPPSLAVAFSVAPN